MDYKSIKWIQDNLNGQIVHFKSSRNFYRKAAFYVMLVSALLSGLTTFFIGISEVVGFEHFSIMALATSATLSALTSFASAYSYREHWIRSNNALMNLYELNADIAFSLVKEGDLTAEQVDGFYERMISILNSSNRHWEEERGDDGHRK